jgi:hypothetical protein
MFVDVRLRRSVRAPGFSGDAFKKTIGVSRYKWIHKLGNRSIANGENRVRIDDPSAAADLLNLAIENYKRKRRVLFFCSCEDINVWKCHRHVVAKLLLKEARRFKRQLEIVEWPGGSPVQRHITVSDTVVKAVLRGRKSVPVGNSAIAKGLATLPWGSIVVLHAEGQGVRIVSGPAKYQRTWYLPVLQFEALGSEPSRLKAWAERFRESRGLNASRA